VAFTGKALVQTLVMQSIVAMKNITNNQHVLHRFLPVPLHALQNYKLHSRRHNLELPDRVSQLNFNFIKENAAL